MRMAWRWSDISGVGQHCKKDFGSAGKRAKKLRVCIDRARRTCFFQLTGLIQVPYHHYHQTSKYSIAEVLKEPSRKLPKHGGQAEARRSSQLGKLRDGPCDIMGRRFVLWRAFDSIMVPYKEDGQDQPCLPAVCISGRAWPPQKARAPGGHEAPDPSVRCGTHSFVRYLISGRTLLSRLRASYRRLYASVVWFLRGIGQAESLFFFCRSVLRRWGGVLFYLVGGWFQAPASSWR